MSQDSNEQKQDMSCERKSHHSAKIKDNLTSRLNRIEG